MVLRKIVLALVTVVGAFLLLAMLATLIGGVFGLIWKWIAKQFNFYGTASDALKKLGNPKYITEWFKSILDFIWNYIIKPVVDWFAKLFKKK